MNKKTIVAGFISLICGLIFAVLEAVSLIISTGNFIIGGAFGGAVVAVIIFSVKGMMALKEEDYEKGKEETIGVGAGVALLLFLEMLLVIFAAGYAIELLKQAQQDTQAEQAILAETMKILAIPASISFLGAIAMIVSEALIKKEKHKLGNIFAIVGYGITFLVLVAYIVTIFYGLTINETNALGASDVISLISIGILFVGLVGGLLFSIFCFAEDAEQERYIQSLLAKYKQNKEVTEQNVEAKEEVPAEEAKEESKVEE